MCAYFRIFTRYNSICFRTRDRQSSHATNKRNPWFSRLCRRGFRMSSTNSTHYVLDNNHKCCSSYVFQPGCTIVTEDMQVRRYLRLTLKATALSSCLHRASMIIKHFIIQLMHNIQYLHTIKIIKYLKVLQHFSDYRGSIIREPDDGSSVIRNMLEHF